MLLTEMKKARADGICTGLFEFRIRPLFGVAAGITRRRACAATSPYAQARRVRHPRSPPRLRPAARRRCAPSAARWRSRCGGAAPGADLSRLRMRRAIPWRGAYLPRRGAPLWQDALRHCCQYASRRTTALPCAGGAGLVVPAARPASSRRPRNRRAVRRRMREAPSPRCQRVSRCCARRFRCGRDRDGRRDDRDGGCAHRARARSPRRPRRGARGPRRARCRGALGCPRRRRGR